MSRNRAMQFESKKAHGRILAIHRLLSERPMRVSELAEKVGITVNATYLYLRHLSSQVHVLKVDTSAGFPARMYAWGAIPGAINKPPELKAEQPRVRQAPAFRGISPARYRRFAASNFFKPQPPRRDPSVAMFFGEAR